LTANFHIKGKNRESISVVCGFVLSILNQRGFVPARPETGRAANGAATR
jgi:hypothetical protein